jgi:hypothetical protein
MNSDEFLWLVDLVTIDVYIQQDADRASAIGSVVIDALKHLPVDVELTSDVLLGNQYGVDWTDGVEIHDDDISEIQFDQGRGLYDDIGTSDDASALITHEVNATDDAGVTSSQIVTFNIVRGDVAVPTDSQAYYHEGIFLDVDALTDVRIIGKGMPVVAGDDSNPTDVISLGFGVPGADSAAPTDSIQRTSVVAYADSVPATDAAVVTPGRQVAAQDTAHPTDPVGLARDLVLVEPAVATDAAGMGPALGQTDLAGATDEQAWVALHAFTDNAGSTDGYLLSVGRGLPHTDDVVVADPAVLSKTTGINITDPAGTTEYFTAMFHDMVFTDQVGTTDATQQAPGRTEEAGLVDVVGLSRTLDVTEQTGTTDPANPGLSGGLSVLDQMPIPDATVWGYGRGPTDPAGLVDSYTSLRFQDVRGDENAGLTDVVLFERYLVASDAVTVGLDGVVLSSAKTASESVTTSDASELQRITVVADSVSIEDAFALSMHSAVDDSVTTADPVVIVLSIDHSIVDSEGVTDSARVVNAITLTLLDDSGVTDVPVVACPAARNITVRVVLAEQARLVAQLATQGRITVVVAEPPRIKAELGVQL